MQLLGTVLALALLPATGPAPARVVPARASSPAAPGVALVVHRWARAIRDADFPRAAELFAPGAHVQDAGAIERLRTRLDRLVFNASLPCAPDVRSVGAGADGYAIVDVLLLERGSRTCGSSAGEHARLAVRVSDGQISEWYPLP